MPVFELAQSKTQFGSLPESCRDVIKNYARRGMFDPESIYGCQDKVDCTTFYLLLTQDCNANCYYCYQPKEFRKSCTSMSKEVVDSTVKFIYNNFDESKVKFSFFGGEPLLNFDVLKYAVETYPAMPSIVTTNGILIKEDPSIADWLLRKRSTLRVSCSVGALRLIYGRERFLDVIKPCLDVVKLNGGDVHYVVDDPSDPRVYDEIVYMIDYGVPAVRVSAIRHWAAVREMSEAYVALFKKVADYVYFTGKPKFGNSQWDTALKNNIYNKNKGNSLRKHPPTFCGCGYLYLAVDRFGDIYPCDFFANFPEFKIGSIYKGFNSSSVFFAKMKDWVDGLYSGCSDCAVCEDKDIRLCPTAMCLAENYVVNGQPLKPAPNHCARNKIEYELYDYIAKKAIETGVDKLYAGSRI